MKVSKALQSHLRPVDELIVLPGNPRQGDIGAISESLERFGQLKPVVIDEDGVILAGNHTYMAAKALGWEHVAAVTADELEGAEKSAFALADNRLSDLATYDNELLYEMATHVLEETESLAGIGYDAEDVDDLRQELDYEPREGELLTKPPDKPTTQTGDVWRLGDHTLICGDAFTVDIGEVDCVVTDPPYAIYGSSSGVSSKAADDRMVEPFFRNLMGRLTEVLPPGGHAYVHCDWRSWSALWSGARSTDMAVKNMLVWDKSSSGMGNNYANSYELLAFLHHWPERKMIASQEAPRNHRQVLASNILRFTREHNKLHNAAKPVPLLEELINNSSDLGDLICDMFAGSGSTLMAAANTQRQSINVEIEPGWCDVIVHRFRTAYPEATVERVPAD